MTILTSQRDALMDLHALYASTIDGGDAEGWAACFTPDGVLETSRPLVVSGRQALVAFAEDRARASASEPERHISWHHRFAAIDDESISGSCSAALIRTTAAGVQVVFTARYDDHFVLVAERWLLAGRRVSIDSATRVPD